MLRKKGGNARCGFWWFVGRAAFNDLSESKKTKKQPGRERGRRTETRSSSGSIERVRGGLRVWGSERAEHKRKEGGACLLPF